MSDVVFGVELSCDQSAGSTWWIGLLSWVFIYVEMKHHFKGRKRSGSVSLGEIKNREFVLARTDVRSLAEDRIMDRKREIRMGSPEGSQM
jgi:hypothetical protein